MNLFFSIVDVNQPVVVVLWFGSIQGCIDKTCDSSDSLLLCGISFTEIGIGVPSELEKLELVVEHNWFVLCICITQQNDIAEKYRESINSMCASPSPMIIYDSE